MIHLPVEILSLNNMRGMIETFSVRKLESTYFRVNSSRKAFRSPALKTSGQKQDMKAGIIV